MELKNKVDKSRESLEEARERADGEKRWLILRKCRFCSATVPTIGVAGS